MIYLPPAEDTAQEIFEAANDAMADHNYVRAVQLYNKLKDAYPFSPYTVDAELSLGDAYYLDEEYTLAAENYKAIPYVLYQIGMSLMKQFQSIDRPTTVLDEAVSYFERVVQQYPGTPYAEGAKKNIGICRKNMAEHELYIADMFWHMEKYGPAWHRYEYIVKNYADVTAVAAHAKAKSAAAYHEYTVQASEERRLQREGSWRDWFKWL